MIDKHERGLLRNMFSEGARPSGKDFAELIESFINIDSDELSVDPADKSLVVTGGVELGTTNRAVAGTLRFAAGTVEVHDGTNYVPISGGGGGSSVFQPVGGGNDVAYGLGNVGVGNFAAAPTFALEVNIGANNSEADRVRFGNAVLSNFPGAATDACFSHRNRNLADSIALRQRSNGEVRINAPGTQRIRFQQDGSIARMTIIPNGNVVIGGVNQLGGANAGHRLQVAGGAFKNDGSGQWAFTSDRQVKDHIRELDYGLDKVLQVQPVRFCYNGKAGTEAGAENIGIIGQEIEEIFPEMVRRVPVQGEDDLESDDLCVFDGSALQFILVNAIKELAAKVEKLEADLDAATAPE